MKVLVSKELFKTIPFLITKSYQKADNQIYSEVVLSGLYFKIKSPLFCCFLFFAAYLKLLGPDKQND